MGTPLAPADINVGDKIRKMWVVKKKLGEGSCGVVYLVQNSKLAGIEGRAAMKVEPFMKSRDDEILKMEVCVLRKLQKSRHACRLLMSGKEKSYSFLVMSILGKDLNELRRRFPDRKMSLASTLKIGLQSVQAVSDLHSAGFVHRDVKPTNFAFGALNKANLYIFDFGLSRQILIPDDGKMKLREPRTKVLFRGTVRYCSINVHQCKEQGRHDDLWSCLYTLIELLKGTLPWKDLARRDSGNLKDTIPDKTLFAGCPLSFPEMNSALKKLTYHDTPPYEQFIDLLKADLIANNAKLTDPFEWESKESKESRESKESKVVKKKHQSEEAPPPTPKSKDEKIENDGGTPNNNDRTREAIESVENVAPEQ